MASKDYIVGIDGGTGGVRAFVFDLKGNVISSGDCEYETQYPFAGMAEQNPKDWINAVNVSVKKAAQNIDASRIKALCAATTSCTVVCCDENANELAPAILWMDVRAAKQAEEICKLTSQSLSAETFICKALWIKQNNEDLWQNTKILCEYQDYLNYYLTNTWCFSVNTTCNWGYNSRKNSFDKQFYTSINLSDALPKLPEKAVKAGEIIGKISANAAKDMGLDEDVVIVQGGIDSAIGMLGMGVAQEGDIALMTGSSNLAMAVTKSPLFTSEQAVNSGADFLLDGYYNSVQGQAATGSILKWFKREFCKDLGKDAFAVLDKEAKDIAAGSDNLLILDYWQGNRAPYNDANAKGVILGLTMSTTRAQIFKAVMESVAFGTQDVLLMFKQKNYKANRVMISGGTTRSDVFLQIHSDVSGIEFCVTSDYSVALGSAILCAFALKEYSSIQTAVQNMVSYQKIVSPNLKNHEIYKELQKKYTKLYEAIKTNNLI